MRAVPIFLGVVCLLCMTSAPSSGGPQGAPQGSEQAKLRAELSRLAAALGPDHPETLAVKARLGALDDLGPKGLVLVLTRSGAADATLRDTRVQQLGGRKFLVGVEEKTDYTKGSFPGKKVWIALDEVTRLVELDGPRPEKE